MALTDGHKALAGIEVPQPVMVQQAHQEKEEGNQQPVMAQQAHQEKEQGKQQPVMAGREKEQGKQQPVMAGREKEQGKQQPVMAGREKAKAKPVMAQKLLHPVTEHIYVPGKGESARGQTPLLHQTQTGT